MNVTARGRWHMSAAGAFALLTVFGVSGCRRPRIRRLIELLGHPRPMRQLGRGPQELPLTVQSAWMSSKPLSML